MPSRITDTIACGDIGSPDVERGMAVGDGQAPQHIGGLHRLQPQLVPVRFEHARQRLQGRAPPVFLLGLLVLGLVSADRGEDAPERGHAASE